MSPLVTMIPGLGNYQLRDYRCPKATMHETDIGDPATLVRALQMDVIRCRWCRQVIRPDARRRLCYTTTFVIEEEP